MSEYSSSGPANNFITLSVIRCFFCETAVSFKSAKERCIDTSISKLKRSGTVKLQNQID